MKTILIIDDDFSFAEASKMLLETQGYNVIHKSNPEEGYKTAISEKIDLILLDVMMETKTDGINLAQKFHKTAELKNVPVILVTGIKKDLNLAFGLEADEELLPVKTVVEKPVKPEELISYVKKYI
jgi:response regulator RpfG family c-di-GMP phosphodiesterase